MLTEYNTTIIVCKCDMCCQLLYEGDKVLILKETKDTIICPMFCDDIFIYDCSFDPIKILQYIYNILKKRTKTNWEKTLIQNCLRHNLIKIEKIF